MTEWDAMQAEVRRTVVDRQLSYEQRVFALAKLAENVMPYPEIPGKARALLASGTLSDLAEGAAPYRPRYMLPDYARFLRQGSEYLELTPPEDLDEALSHLAILYRSVPSITGYPVYLGDLDELLEPFAAAESDDSLLRKVTLFLRLVDRTCQDGFVHAVLGPRETRTGHAILAAERRLRQAVPNWSFKYDPAVTPDSLLLDAIATCCEVSKPHFVNDPAAERDLPRYSVASCYNTLPLGGGSFTLSRLNLRRLAEETLAAGAGREQFLAHDLPEAAAALLAIIAARTRFIVEEAGFFESSFLVREGLLEKDRFTAMFGVVGLAEAVDLLLGRPGAYGHTDEALVLAKEILEGLKKVTLSTPVPYCTATGGHALLHAQAGLSDDKGVTPGIRIPAGTEPELLDHLLWLGQLHSYFPLGISDPVHFEPTVRNNPRAVADVLKGAFRSGMREFTFALAGSEFVRVTGYLVRRRDLELLAAGQVSRYDTTALAAPVLPEQGVDRRRVRGLDGFPGRRS